MKNYLENLNEMQLQAVKHKNGPMLILAGAGSGKTKTIVSRLAYLIDNYKIPPQNTLTLTFTNKAANEMRQRALSLIKTKNFNPLLCTFHKFGLLFLKFHINKLNRKNIFSIIDIDDKKRILKQIIGDDDSLKIPVLNSEISKYKNSLLSPKEAKENISTELMYIKQEIYNFQKKICEIYEKYENYLLEKNLVDFDDLLVLCYKILDENIEIATQISNKYKYIMVDEYQDTNNLQYKILQKLCLCHDNLCVVGDDDQSIYGWRGAKIENILNFQDEFKDTKVIRLEKNYRSTNQILQAANELISHNKNRLGKNLISTIENGKDIEFLDNENEQNESFEIAKKVLALIKNGVEPKDIAILYRVNALSRSLEDGLNKAEISYKIVAGTKFYERAEIKDIIAYLRIILNPNDDFSLLRIINRPKRGIGNKMFSIIEQIALNKNISLFEALLTEEISALSQNSQKAIKKFCEDINNIKNSDNLIEMLDKFEKLINLKGYYENLQDGNDKIANIDEFYALLKDKTNEDENFDLETFLNEISLQSDQDSISDNSLNLMSIHASKGLEFDYVFVIGLEEGFFPLIGSDNDIEEERRLAYVAITRAKKSLTLSYAKSRFYRGRREEFAKSRFLSETGLCKGSLVIEEKKDYKKFDLVKHKIFGIGKVLSVQPTKNQSKLTISFGGNVKEIMSDFIEKI